MFENLSASYDVGIAKKYGINSAVLLNKLIYLQKYTTRNDGYCWRSAKELEDELGLSRYQQELAIKKLEEAGMLETKNTYIIGTQIKCKHFKIVGIKDINMVIQETNKTDFKETSKSEMLETSKSEMLETSKSVNNNNTLITKLNNQTIINNNNIEKIPYKEVIDYLNMITDSHYRYSSKKTKELIKARFNDGFTLNDFKIVITKKTKEWINNKQMRCYLRPETLFGSKFESYLNQKEYERTTKDLTFEEIDRAIEYERSLDEKNGIYESNDDLERLLF